MDAGDSLKYNHVCAWKYSKLLNSLTDKKSCRKNLQQVFKRIFDIIRYVKFSSSQLEVYSDITQLEVQSDITFVWDIIPTVEFATFLIGSDSDLSKFCEPTKCVRQKPTI